MDILDDMGVSKLSAKVFFLKVNYSFKRFRGRKMFLNSIFTFYTTLFEASASVTEICFGTADFEHSAFANDH